MSERSEGGKPGQPVIEDAQTQVSAPEARGGGQARRPEVEVAISQGRAGPRSFQTQLSAGQLIAGRFQVQSVAGVGGMGVVYRAYDQQEHTVVAVKMLRQVAQRARFARESRLLSALSHPNVVKYVAHGEIAYEHEAPSVGPAHAASQMNDDELVSESSPMIGADGDDDAGGLGQAYLVMEWLEGMDLGTFLKSHQLSIQQSVELARQVAAGLAAAHEHGIVHRDINPSNLFLVAGSLSGVKILDFGIARGPAGSERFTTVGSPVGTPGYMAPEQAQGTRQITARADLFGLGCVLFECLTGRRAFQGRTLMELFARILVDDVPPASQLNPSVPTALERLVQRMLRKSPEERPASAQEVLALLSQLENLSEVVPDVPADSAPSSAITDSEQRLSSVILVGAIDAEVYSDVVRRALRYGVRPQRLADGSLIATLQSRGSATEQVAEAARCALDIRDRVDPARVALATGRVLTSGRWPVGEAIERASGALLGVRDVTLADQHAGAPQPVLIDKVTASFLDARFDTLEVGAEILLTAAHETQDAVRSVLGHRTQCVGRRRELSMLDATFEECAEDSVARAVLVTGPPGIGKTRLAQEFAGKLRTDPESPEILMARGEPTSVGSPFAILARAIRQWAGVAEGASEGQYERRLEERLARHVAADRLSRVTEFLAQLIGAPRSDGASPELEAARFDPVLLGDQKLRALEDWLEAECRAHPVLLVLDDFHWGDLPTVKFIDSLLRNLRDSPLMVVVLAQPQVHEIFPDLWGNRGVSELKLAGLSRRASELFVRDVLGEDVAPRVVDRIVERAQGNPFWLEELLRAEHDGVELPDAIVLLAQARLERLDADARRVLRAASILGRRFWDDAVKALVGQTGSDRTLNEVLGHVEEREIVISRSQSRFVEHREFEFRSGLLREAAYGTLTDEDRVRGHLGAAHWLEHVGERDAVALAEHYRRGQRPDSAVSWYLRAAEQALEGNDWSAARERAQKGLAAGATGELAARLALVEAEANKWMGNNAPALASSEAALSHADRGSQAWCRAAGEAVATAGKLGRPDVYGPLGKELLDCALSPENDPGLLVALSRSATQMALSGELGLAEKLLGRVHDLFATREVAPSVAGWLLEARAVVAAAKDDAGDRARLAEEAADRFEQAGDLRNACLQRISFGFACVEIGADERAVSALESALTVAERMGLSNSIPIARVHLGRAMARSGNLKSAREVEARALAEFDRHDNRRLGGVSRCYLALMELEVPNVAEAERLAKEAVDLLEPVPAMLRLALASLARVHLAKSEPSLALACSERATEGLEGDDKTFYGEALVRLVHYESLAAVGEREKARRALETAQKRLWERASRITDEELRQCFVARVPEHAKTLALTDL